MLNQSTLFYEGAEKTSNLLNADVLYIECSQMKSGCYELNFEKIKSKNITKKYVDLLQKTINDLGLETKFFSFEDNKYYYDIIKEHIDYTEAMQLVPFERQDNKVGRYYHSYDGMEDVDFVRRIGMSRLVLFDVEAKTSAKRYLERGYFIRIVRNFICLSLYFLKVPPDKIYKFYG